MKLLKDHPVISSLINGGIPEDPECNCPRCGYNYDCGTLYQGEVPLFKIDGEWVCFECFESWYMDLLQTNPEMIAEGLGVGFKLMV